MDSHFLEDVAEMIRDRLEQDTDVMAKALTPADGRPLFSKKMSRREALAWWQEHFSDPLGQEAMENLSPQEQMELQLALSQANEEMMYGGT